ncbi:DUF3348 family protein [Piscinibacter sakaiensis]|uniref:DUF3348 domain-containing protein n=1 Tax=Piscinibacter sakaiensis TaxID=1547922 RepID=A0A0K8P7T3_PISS1|nr:DUF3348 family protein [Piscinibacter sakaiensis]GAP38708.1 hypothetical protein ISF6_5261 [Piscinibacter sakaiensis]
MVQARRSVGPSRLPLVALLGQLGGDGATAPRPDFADTLGQWLGWTEAIALAAALEGPVGAGATAPRSGAAAAARQPAAAAAEPQPASSAAAAHPAASAAGGARPRARPGHGAPTPDDPAALLRELRRERLQLEAAIDDEADGDASPGPAGRHGRPPGPGGSALPGPGGSAPPVALDPAAEFTVCRHRYLAQRQRIEQAVAGLRARLRATLARRGPAAARLAAVDAVMERAIGAQEQRLLALLPAWLEQQFRRRLQGGGGGPGASVSTGVHGAASGASDARGGSPLPPPARAAAPAAATAAPAATARPAWLQQYEADQRAVLHAELDLRFLPVEALLEALHPAPPAVPAPVSPPIR